MSQTALSFDKLYLGYDSEPAVMGVSADVLSGSLTAIVGPNGAGKSTLMKGVVGLLSPLQGRIGLGTKDKRDIAYLPQQSEVDRSFPITVRDLVAMGLWQKVGAFGGFGGGQGHKIEEAIAAVGLTGLEGRIIGSLSGGQMQRALFARLLLQDASLVLLDEPFNSVDERTISDLIGVVTRWHDEGRTVMAVLHDHDTVRDHFPDVMMIARELIGHGPTAQILTSENNFRARQMCEACADFPHTCGRAA